MKAKRKQRVIRAVSISSGMIFLMGALDFMSNGKIAFGALQIVAGLLNLLSALPEDRLPRWRLGLKYGVLALNVLVAITVAIDYAQAGTQYIQYAWAIVAIISTVALIIQWRKDGKEVKELEC